MSGKVYVRLAPYAPRHGNMVQRYVYRGQLFTGGDRPTWYKVSKALADELKLKRQVDGDMLSRPLFEIKDEEEKELIQAEEHRRALAALGVTTPTMPVPHDLRPADTLEIADLDDDSSGGALTSKEATGRAAALTPERGVDYSSSDEADADEGVEAEVESESASDMVTASDTASSRGRGRRGRRTS